MKINEVLVEAKTVEFNGITLKVIKKPHELRVEALDDWGNNVLGYVEFNIGDSRELDPQDLRVDDRYQGQGIAKTMYDYVKTLGYNIVRSWDQTDAGAGFWDKHRGEDVRVWEGVPQPGQSSGAPTQFAPGTKIQTRPMTAQQIISSIPGVPYYNNVVDDYDAKDYSWGVTQKVIEYAEYLKQHPESLAKLPPIQVVNGQFKDGAHRVSAVWLLQQRLDPKNSLWKTAKLNVQFVGNKVTESFDRPGQHECINEIFGSAEVYQVAWKWGGSNDVEAYGTFTTSDGRVGRIVFEETSVDPQVVDFEFEVGSSKGISGGGDQYAIFNTVIQAFEIYLKTKKPEYVTFSAKEPNRFRIYAKLVDRLINGHGTGKTGYQWLSKDNFPANMPPGHNDFVIAREYRKQYGVLPSIRQAQFARKQAELNQNS